MEARGGPPSLREARRHVFFRWRAARLSILALPLSLALLLLTGAISEPENVNVTVDVPSLIERGEDFEIHVYLTNTANTPQTLVDLEIDDVPLDAIEIDSSEPEFSASEPIGFAMSYSYDMELPPGDEVRITLFASATQSGDHTGDFGFCTNTELICLYYPVRIGFE